MRYATKSPSAVSLIVLCLIMSAQQSCKRPADAGKGFSDTCICYIYDDVHDIVISGDNVFGQRLKWGGLTRDYSQREFFVTTTPAALRADLACWASAEGDLKTLRPEESAIMIETIDSAAGGKGRRAYFRPQNQELRQWLSALEQAVFSDEKRVDAVPDWVRGNKTILGMLGMVGVEATAAQSTDKQLIRRAVFLSWMKHFTEGRDTSQTLFFLVLEPGEEGDIPAIYKGFRVLSSDESVIDQDPLRDKKTGERGLGLEAEHVTIKGMSAEVYGTFFSSAYSMGAYSFRLQKIGGTWTVIEVKQLWIT